MTEGRIRRTIATEKKGQSGSHHGMEAFGFGFEERSCHIGPPRQPQPSVMKSILSSHASEELAKYLTHSLRSVDKSILAKVET